jgi:hypothetical protein
VKVPVRLRIAGRSGSLARSRQPPRRLKLPRTTVSEKKKNRPSRLSSVVFNHWEELGGTSADHYGACRSRRARSGVLP